MSYNLLFDASTPYSVLMIRAFLTFVHSPFVWFPFTCTLKIQTLYQSSAAQEPRDLFLKRTQWSHCVLMATHLLLAWGRVHHELPSFLGCSNQSRRDCMLEVCQSTPNQPIIFIINLYYLFRYWCQLFLGDMVTTRPQLSWNEELHLMSSWTRCERHNSVSRPLTHSSSLAWRMFIYLFIFVYWTSCLAYFYRMAFVPKITLIMEVVIRWRWRLAVIPRSGHKSETECFVAEGQSSSGKRQMWDSRSIWAKPSWCQQADQQWRHIRDQHPPENSWSESGRGADNRLAAASC